MKLRFDHGPDGRAGVFQNARSIIRADAPGEVADALAAMDQARADGQWVAGYATYELGYALEPKLAPLMPENRRLPLLQFGVYDWPVIASDLKAGSASLSKLTPNWDEVTYKAAFDTVHENITKGEIYQANLTFSAALQAAGNPQALYAALINRQPVRFGVLIEQKGLAILSRSPELFFRTDAQGRIQTRPMKGTAPRDKNPLKDAQSRMYLQWDEKNRAENLMIVDLLRNDISRICQAGSVQVPELFTVESYETVHQMTSLVVGQTKDGTGLSDILRALFPCGSITGAPKLRAMEILRDLESNPREIYCGSIGWAAPDGRAEFNVAIRTLLLDGADATLNIGGGVVYDSTSDGEYEEALVKSRFSQI